MTQLTDKDIDAAFGDPKQNAIVLGAQDNEIAAYSGEANRTVIDPGSFKQMVEACAYIARADILPSHFRGKPENVFIALSAAEQFGISWLQMIQNSYIVSGKLGLSAQMAIALVNMRGPFNGPIQWRFDKGEGDDGFTCWAYATHKRTGDKLELDLTWKTVKAEGWLKNPKWLNMGKQMFRYRTAMFFARAYCPEVLMGFQTNDELEDTYGVASHQSLSNNVQPPSPEGEDELPPEEKED